MSTMLRRSSTALALVIALGLVACGESKEEKAKAQVCSARSDISKQVTALSSLTLSTEVVSEAKAHIEAIGSDLGKIKSAQPDLEPARREQVEKATHQFEAEVKAATDELTSNLSLTNAKSKLTSAAHQLATGYKQALEPIDCS
jgi:hypothetical protein